MRGIFTLVDLAGWPKKEAYALVVRASRFNQTVTGVNLKILPPDLQPYRTITNDDLVRDKVADVWYDDPQPMLVPIGTSARLLGQPVAILFFDTAQKYRDAARLLQFHEDALIYGDVIVPIQMPGGFPRARFLTRFEDEFSQTKDGRTDPNGHAPKGPASEGFPRENPRAHELRRVEAFQANVHDAGGRSDVPRAGDGPRLVRLRGRKLCNC